jgi:hypothetical protein
MTKINFLNSILKSFTVLSLLAILSSCASVPMSSLENDREMKKFEVSTNKSRIYVYRDEIFGSAITVPVSLDGKIKGKTAPHVYFSWDVEPGEHEISCFAENNSKIKLNAQPGQSHFVWQEIKMGMWQAGCALQEVEKQKGQAAVNSCKLAESN